MTIEETIGRIQDHKIIHKMNEPRAVHISEALDMAIRSLEAWEKVKAEIQKYQDPTKKECQFDSALNLCLKIIDKHTREVEE